MRSKGSVSNCEENYIDQDFEMDIECEPNGVNNTVNTNVSIGVNNKFSSNCRQYFMKPCSSQELADETERVFEDIMKANLEEKLALYDT